MTFLEAGRWNVKKFQICIQLLSEVNPGRRLCYEYKYAGSYGLTSFRKYHWNSLTVRFSSHCKQSYRVKMRLLASSLTLQDFISGNSFLQYWFQRDITKKMFRNNQAFVFLAVIGFVTLGSKVTSGRSAAFSSLSQRSRF